MNKKVVFILVLIFIFSITSISIGLYINSLNKPKRILSESINFIHDEGKKYIFPNDNLVVGDTYTSTGSIDFNLNSEYYLRKSKNEEESLKKYNFINNISNMDTNFIIKQDRSNKSNYIEISQKIGDEDIVDYKRLVDNSTEYYFINGILKNYVNNGTCNYFEALTENNTTRSNIDYLYDFIFKSLQNNLKDEYFKSYDVVTSIRSKDTNVHQISIKFDNKITRNILNGILKDLKEDKKANNILSNVDKNFKKYKVKSKNNIFKKDESYILNIYTTKVLNKPLKYELIHMGDSYNESYIIEKNNNIINYYYLEDNNIMYTANITIFDNNINGKIYNSSTEEIGGFILEKDGNNLSFDYNFDNSDEKINLKYISKYDNVKNKVSYINTKSLNINYLVNKEVKLSGNIEYKNKVVNKAKINTDIGNTTLYSKLSDEEKELIKNKRDMVKNRLER